MRTGWNERTRVFGAGVIAAAALLGMGAAATPTLAQAYTVEDTHSAISPERRAEHVESFDYVWQSILDHQWDPAFDRAGWDAERAKLRPRVEAAWSDWEARAAMMELIDSLGKSHFGIIPSEAYDVLTPDEDEASDDGDTGGDADGKASPDKKKDAEKKKHEGPGDSGITVRYRGGELLVVRVREGSGAADAGVEPGWVIERMGTLDAATLIAAAKESAGVQRVDTICAIGAERRLAGDAGTTIDVEFRTPEGKTKSVTIERGPEPGEKVRFGNLPDVRVYQVTKTLADGVGYYWLNTFLDPPSVMPVFERFVREHLEAPGLVIDMRGNHGGIITMSMGFGGWLVDEPNIYLGTLTVPNTQLKLVLNPRDVTYTGPVAVLIDEESISNAELLAAGLKDIGRARVFGHRSAGLLLPSVVELLPNGDGFQYAFADYTSANGESPEGVGVEPDVDIEETPESLEGGRDPVLKAALEWIGSEPH